MASTELVASQTPGMSKKKCGVLGCTGSVGQRFILLLADHPTLTLQAIGASSRSAGKTYRDAVRWKQGKPMSEELAKLEVRECRASAFGDCDLVFSGLDSDVAGEIELEFIHAEIPIFSNAKNHRRDPLIPLVVPLVNLPHLDLIHYQRQQLKLQRGFLVCNSNCAVIGIVIPFAALQSRFGPIEDVEVFTQQALSGAGYPGVSSMDIIDNVVPYIAGEEDKLETEAQKILGSLGSSNTNSEDNNDNTTTNSATKNTITPQSPLTVNATCTRVPVTDGHMACISARFTNRPPPSSTQIKQALRDYTPEAQTLNCPSAPSRAIVVFDDDQLDRPQPRLDRDLSGGYAVSVGRVREGGAGHFDVRFVVLSHNTVIGAAGSSILNAEAAIIKGFI